MAFLRPALVPEPLRPLVLSPIYLVRNFINIFIFFVEAIVCITGLFVGTIPLNMALVSFTIKAVAALLLASMFAAAVVGINSKRKHLVHKLDRLEDLCAGDLLAAASLARDLAQDSASWTMATAADFFGAVKNVDIGETASDVVDKVGDATSIVTQTSVDVIRNVSKDSVEAVQSVAGVSVDAGKTVAHATSDAIGKTAGFAGWATKGAFNAIGSVTSKAADETVGLLSNPVGTFGSIAKGTVDAGEKAANAAVNVVGNSGKIATDIVESTVDAGNKAAGIAIDAVESGAEFGGKIAGSALDIGIDAAGMVVGAGESIIGGTAKLTMGGLKQIMSLDPIYIFRRIVHLVMKVSFYIVVGLPGSLIALGVVLWIFGIYPSMIQIVLFVALLVFGVPGGWYWVRRRAMAQLDVAGLEIIKFNAQKAGKAVSSLVNGDGE